MKDLKTSIKLIKKYNEMPLEDVVKELEEHGGHSISKDIVQKFKLTGLNNIDFLTSNFLHQFKIKNLLDL